MKVTSSRLFSLSLLCFRSGGSVESSLGALSSFSPLPSLYCFSGVSFFCFFVLVSLCWISLFFLFAPSFLIFFFSFSFSLFSSLPLLVFHSFLPVSFFLFSTFNFIPPFLLLASLFFPLFLFSLPSFSSFLVPESASFFLFRF